MFNPFKKSSKKFKPISEYPENWSIIEESLNPTIIRVNMGYKDAIGHSDYPIKMGIAIPVEQHDDAVMDLKSEIEDILNDILFQKQVKEPLLLVLLVWNCRDLLSFYLTQKRAE